MKNKKLSQYHEQVHLGNKPKHDPYKNITKELGIQACLFAFAVLCLSVSAYILICIL